MEDIRALLMNYELNNKQAQVAESNGNLKLAKELYIKAAEVLFKVANKSPKELKSVRLDKVKYLILRANNLKIKKSNIEEDMSDTSNPDKNEFKEGKIPDVKFKDVIGIEKIRPIIEKKIFQPLKYPEHFKKYGMKAGGGVLMYGPPGTGKTTMAKAIANEAGAAFYEIKSSDILDKYVGESEKNIKRLFDLARKEKFAIIFFDDMETLFKKRGTSDHSDQRVTEFLTQIDGFQGRASNILLLGSTNAPWLIDEAVGRSGRFTEKIYVALPNFEDRILLFKKFLENIPCDDKIDFNTLAEMTDTYSGSDIFEVCNHAKERALDVYIDTNKLENVNQDDLIRGIKMITPFAGEDYFRKIEAYHTSKTSIHEKQEKKTTIKVDEVINELPKVKEFDKKIYLIPGELPKVRFVLTEFTEDINIEIDTSRYVCFKDLNYIVTDELNITEAGTYSLSIFKKDQLLDTIEVEFVKGVEKNNMGI